MNYKQTVLKQFNKGNKAVVFFLIYTPDIKRCFKGSIVIRPFIDWPNIVLFNMFIKYNSEFYEQ